MLESLPLLGDGVRDPKTSCPYYSARTFTGVPRRQGGEVSFPVEPSTGYTLSCLFALVIMCPILGVEDGIAGILNVLG